jgi:FkbM family methyltransferase
MLPSQVRDVVPDSVKRKLSDGIIPQRYTHTINMQIEQISNRILKDYSKTNYRLHYDSALRKIYSSEELPSPTIRVLDIGARWGPQSKYSVLDDIGALQFTGVEADDEEADRLNQRHPRKTFISTALSDSTGRKELYLTKHRGWSSLYKPNQNLLNRFDFYEEEYIIEDTIKIDTTTLDALSEEIKEDYDLIKIDAQGSEGDIVSGGKKTISDSLAIEFETHFKPLYKDQPLFYEIHEMLSELGYTIIDISSGDHYYPWARDGKPSPPNPDGEIVEQEPLYLNFSDVSRERVLKLMIISILYGKKSIAYHLLDEQSDSFSEREYNTLTHIINEIPSKKR